jgi:nucleoside-diphosphate-sugar epimerase
MVFVTGGTGLLGGYLLRELVRKGEKIKALYRSDYPFLLNQQEINSIEWVKGDILDTFLLHQICSEADEVYHCAGMVSFNPARKYEMLNINVVGTANVVNACIAGGVKKLVHVSSVSALGRKRNNVIVTERPNGQKKIIFRATEKANTSLNLRYGAESVKAWMR